MILSFEGFTLIICLLICYENLYDTIVSYSYKNCDSYTFYAYSGALKTNPSTSNFKKVDKDSFNGNFSIIIDLEISL